MAIEVTMPQMGADMTEGTVIKWLREVGDTIERGDILAEIETDKANVELEAFESGQLLKLVAAEGDVIPVGEVIALLGEPGENVDEMPPHEEQPKGRTRIAKTPEPSPEEDEETPAGAETPEDEEELAPQRAGAGLEEPRTSAGRDAPEEQPAPTGDRRVRISPVARRIASENNLDVSGIQGSGPDGRILRRDVEEALSGKKEAPAAAPPREAAPAAPAAPAAEPAAPTATGEREPLTRIRETIARRMLQSKQTQPHYYLTVDVDMTEAMSFRKTLNEAASESQRVTINDLIVKASVLALQRHPKFTAQFTDDGLIYPEQLDINIGIALPDGLIAPAILDCGNKSLGRIAEDSKGLIERARENRLRADEYAATGAFTITNLGNYGVEALIGIINPPQAAILGVGSAMMKPVVVDGEIVARQVMKIALSADHRVSDGAEGAEFIKEIQNLLENPVSLAL